VELVEIQTTGDQVRDRPLSQMGGIGVFTKEIQRALLMGTVDVAVHSLKDLPTIPVDGLVLAAVPPRGPVGDVFVSRRHRTFDALPTGAVVATGSLRRRAQVLYRRPDLRLVDIRGNVETRLRKLADQDIDALLLARAGLERLGLGDAITENLYPSWMLPAVGQGALGLECRSDDHATHSLLQYLDDVPTRRAAESERSLMRGLGGGCLVPVGVETTVAGDALTLHGAVFEPDGKARVDAELTGSVQMADELGARVAAELLSRGAAALLRLDSPPSLR
jgi:hydroxymethylbilane synthase